MVDGARTHGGRNGDSMAAMGRPKRRATPILPQLLALALLSPCCVSEALGSFLGDHHLTLTCERTTDLNCKMHAFGSSFSSELSIPVVKVYEIGCRNNY